MSTNDDKCRKENENEDSDESLQKLYPTKDIDLMNHPVDVQKNNTSTVDATSQNLQDVELHDDNALLSDDGLSEKNLEPQTTQVELATTPDPLDIVGEVITTVCQVAKEANASVPETEITPPKKCACGSTTHL